MEPTTDQTGDRSRTNRRIRPGTLKRLQRSGSVVRPLLAPNPNHRTSGSSWGPGSVVCGTLPEGGLVSGRGDLPGQPGGRGAWEASLLYNPYTPWDCHRCLHWGGLGGQCRHNCRHIFHTWCVWVIHRLVSPFICFSPSDNRSVRLVGRKQMAVPTFKLFKFLDLFYSWPARHIDPTPNNSCKTTAAV